MDINVAQLIVSIIAGTVVPVIIFIFWIGKYTEKINNLENKNKDLCGDFENKLKDNYERINRLEDKLFERVDRLDDYIKKNSPETLGEKGKIFLVKSGGQKLIDEDFSPLLDRVQNCMSETAFDIQECSYHFIESIFEHNEIEILDKQDNLKNFKNFLFAEGFDKKLAIKILSLYLRDRCIANLEIDISKIKNFTVITPEDLIKFK